MLAYSSDQFINQYIKTVTFVQYTEESIKDAQELLKELCEAYAISTRRLNNALKMIFAALEKGSRE